MSSEDQPTTELRVGGWVPPPPQAPAGHPPLPGSFLAAASATVPQPSGQPATAQASRRRRTVVACAALGVLLVTGTVAWESSRPGQAGTPRFVTLPSVPTVPALPVVPPSASASVSPSPSVSLSPSASLSAPASLSPSHRSASPSASPKTSPSSAKPTAQQPSATGPLAVGATVGLELTNMPGYRIRHQNYRARVDRIGTRSSTLDRADSRFTVRAGLADSSCVSFESSNYPGYYLRHRNGQAWLDRRDTSALYAADATFCPRAGRAAGTVTLRSKNYPDRSLSVRHSRVDLGSSATTFTVRPGL